MQQLPVPPVAPDFRAPQKPLPELNRVGVDMNRQHPLSLREALSMALENNKDIEVARENVRIAEFDLLGAQGVYDPRFTTQRVLRARRKSDLEFSELADRTARRFRAITPAAARLEGQSPILGGSYHLDFSSVRLKTNNQFAALNPQYPDVADVQLHAAAAARIEDRQQPPAD